MSNLAQKISDSELEVLSVLWQAAKPLSLAEIRAGLEGRHWDSSTVKTLVRRLCEKGAVEAEKQTVFYYRPLISQQEYRTWSTRTLIDRLFRGSARQMVACLVEEEQLSRADVQELLDLLDQEDPHGHSE